MTGLLESSDEGLQLGQPFRRGLFNLYSPQSTGYFLADDDLGVIQAQRCEPAVVLKDREIGPQRLDSEERP